MGSARTEEYVYTKEAIQSYSKQITILSQLLRNAWLNSEKNNIACIHNKSKNNC